MSVGPGPQLATVLATLMISMISLTSPPGARAINLPGTLPENQWGSAACSGHGHRGAADRCVCDSYWTGADCGAPEQPPDCGDHGKASGGRCVCEPGWKGRACQTTPMTCTHGKVAQGKCACDPGWSGDVCDKGS